jgi:hypothetical protein
MSIQLCSGVTLESEQCDGEMIYILTYDTGFLSVTESVMTALVGNGVESKDQLLSRYQNHVQHLVRLQELMHGC